jgi:hypothetical protein
MDQGPGTKDQGAVEPTAKSMVAALTIALAFVALTRGPVARAEAFDFDEVGYLEMIREARFPMHHTLFLATARMLGELVGDAYRGFVLLDMIVSALALWAVWWWLRAIVGPWTAAATTLVLGSGPVFWSYGAMAANYTAIPLVGSILLGIAWRGRSAPRAWHPYAAAVVLALGAGYRSDIGTFWLPVLLVILWQHRGIAAAQAVLLCAALSLAWIAPMLHDAGGWAPYRAASARFAHEAGYLNSVWHLGLIDATVRYAVKLALALTWTLGLSLLLVPRGLLRLGGIGPAALLALSVLPALAVHLTIHFGVPGYAFHYLPALAALLALGLGRSATDDRLAAARGLALAATLAATFWFYPADFDRPRGLHRDFDLTVARYTRIGLRTPNPVRDPTAWRTANSQSLPGDSGRRYPRVRKSLLEIWGR